MAEPLDLLADLIARARAAGADAADAVLISGTSLSVQRRLGKTEHVERSEGRDLGLRVFLGQRAAIVSSTTIDPASFKDLAERAVAMARVVPEDPYAGLADTAAPPEQLALDLVDPTEPSTEALVARAAAAEDGGARRAGHHQLRRRRGRLRPHRGLPGDLGRLRRQHGAHQPLGLRHRAGRHRHGDAARLRLPFDRPSGRSGRSGGDRPQRRRARHRAAQPDAAEHGKAAGRVRPARRRRPARPPGRRDQRRLGGARHLVPEGQAGPAHLRRRASRSTTIRAASAACAPACSMARARRPPRAP